MLIIDTVGKKVEVEMYTSCQFIIIFPRISTMNQLRLLILWDGWFWSLMKMCRRKSSYKILHSCRFFGLLYLEVYWHHNQNYHFQTFNGYNDFKKKKKKANVVWGPSKRIYQSLIVLAVTCQHFRCEHDWMGTRLVL